MRTIPRVSTHAIERYRERVDPAASPNEARVALHRFLCLGRNRPRPRHWMRGQRPAPGLSFVYWSGCPDACLLVKEGAVVTVKTRGLFRTEPRPDHIRSVPRPQAKERPWRWDDSLDQAA